MKKPIFPKRQEYDLSEEEFNKILQEFLISTLKTAFKTITPWKKRWYKEEAEQKSYMEHYINGWNDCIKEIKKNRRNYLKFVEKLK